MRLAIDIFDPFWAATGDMSIPGQTLAYILLTLAAIAVACAVLGAIAWVGYRLTWALLPPVRPREPRRQPGPPMRHAA